MATETESGLQTHQSDHDYIEMTQSGDQTVYSSRFNEHFHSKYGAIQESEHVFIQAGYRACLSSSSSSSSSGDTTCRILEVGFGTGLNAFLTLLDVPDGHRVDYVTLEKYPLDPSVVRQLTYPDRMSDYSNGQVLFEQIHGCPWGESVSLSDAFSIYKYQGDLCSSDSVLKDLAPFHCIYFDAFSPETQPELWTLSVFHRLYSVLMTGGRLVTYCAKGVVKRTLAQAGFQVTSLPGPKGKREMVVADKNLVDRELMS